MSLEKTVSSQVSRAEKQILFIELFFIAHRRKHYLFSNDSLMKAVKTLYSFQLMKLNQFADQRRIHFLTSFFSPTYELHIKAT